jgi:hypothetical protein
MITIILNICKLQNWAVDQVAKRWLLAAETCVQSRVTSSEIPCGRSDTEADFSQFLGFPLLIIPLLLHIHHRMKCAITLTNQYIVINSVLS